MGGNLHFAAPTALEYFAALVADDSSLAQTETAVAVAQVAYPQLDPQGTLAEIDRLVDRLRRRLPADTSPLHKLRLLTHYFFQELGFAGNVNDYYDPRNSYLPDVLESRRGIPITLAVLFVEMATQLGLPAAGVSFPGHFLVKLRTLRGEVVLDPFSGRTLSREELDERLMPYRRQRGLVGEFEAPLGLFLQEAAPRDVIARLLRNLKEIHRAAPHPGHLLAVLDRLVVLLPQAWEERRDRALLLSSLGRDEAAVADLQMYLQHRPDADDADDMRQRLLPRHRPPRLH